MTFSPVLHAILLLATAAFACAAAIMARRRTTMPGRSAFVWATVAVVYWATMAALHTLVPSLAGSLRVARRGRPPDRRDDRLDATVREMHALVQASVTPPCRLEYCADGSVPLVKLTDANTAGAAESDRQRC